MALIRCSECRKEVSDKAQICPNCGAPVDAGTSVAAPERLGYADGQIIATPAMMVELAKRAITGLNYKVDGVNGETGTASFTTGMTMGSFSGVSGTISWEEVAPYRYVLSGQGKQNVQGGQAVALNLFNEANGKVDNVKAEMRRLASGGAASEAVPDSSSAIVAVVVVVSLFILFFVMVAR